MRRLSINLASTPFINRVIPLAVLGGVGGVAVLLTLLNLGSFIILGREYRIQQATLKKQEQRLATLEKDTAEKQKILESAGVATFSHEVQFVDRVLQAKRFSWIRMLEDLERVKAYGTMFTTVTPSLGQDGRITITVNGVANPRGEMLKLESNFFADPSFRNVVLSNEQKESGTPMVHFQITCEYLPEAVHAP